MRFIPEFFWYLLAVGLCFFLCMAGLALMAWVTQKKTPDSKAPADE